MKLSTPSSLAFSIAATSVCLELGKLLRFSSVTASTLLTARIGNESASRFSVSKRGDESCVCSSGQPVFG